MSAFCTRGRPRASSAVSGAKWACASSHTFAPLVVADWTLIFASCARSQVFSIRTFGCPCHVDTLGDILWTLLALTAHFSGAISVVAVWTCVEALVVGCQEGVVLTMSALFSAETRVAGRRAHLATTTHIFVTILVVANGALDLASCLWSEICSLCAFGAD